MFGTNLKNTCRFQGRLSKDPEIKSYNGSNGPYKVAYINLAVDRKMTKDEKAEADKNNRPTADFIRLKIGGKTVDFVENWLVKGKSVEVECNYESYTTTNKQTGETEYGHIFNVNNIDFPTNDAKSLQGNNGSSGSGKKSSNSKPKQKDDDFSMFDGDDDDDEWDDDDNPW